MREETRGEDKLWTGNGNDELGEFKVGPLAEDGRWKDEFVHQGPRNCWKTALSTCCNHRSKNRTSIL